MPGALTGATVTNLAAGTYTVSVTDLNDGSLTSASFTIAQPGQLTIVNSVTNVSCFGGTNGSANVIASGGTPPYSYSWSSGGLTPAVTGITAGSYTVTVTDAQGCTATNSITITQPSTLTVNVSTTSASCFAMSNGSVTATVFGGSAPYTYNWAPSGGTAASSTNLVAGTYTVTVTDSHGCVATASGTITEPPQMNVSPNVTDASCGACNGSAQGNHNGGNPPFTYLWTPGMQTTWNATSLCSGNYTLTVTDANGCAASALAMVNEGALAANAFITVMNASCGNSDGSAIIDSISGGVSPYSYLWSPGGQVGQSAVGLSAGVYSVSITDSLGCAFNEMITINNFGGPSAMSVSTVNTACAFNSGEIHIGSVTGGMAPFTYSLNGAAFSSSINYTGLASGTYSITVKDANGCIYTSVSTINVNNAPAISPVITPAACNTSGTGSISLSISGGLPPFSYLWNNGSVSQNLTQLYGGNYSVVVTDSAGCTSSQAFHVPNSTVVYANLTTTPYNCSTPGTATVVASGGQGPYSYLWNTTPVQTTATAIGLTSGNYSCIITDSNGCSATVYAAFFGNCYNVIRGILYNDMNSNCIQDAGEPPLTGKTLVATGANGTFYGISDASGNYTILSNNMNNVVSAYNLLGHVPVCPSTGSLAVNFSSSGDTLTGNNFGYYVSPNVNVGIHPGWSNANPGFQKNYWIFYYNAGYAPQNVVIRMQYDSALVFTGCSAGGVHYPSQHLIEWTFANVPVTGMQILYSQRTQAFFNVPTTLSTSSMLHSYFEILPLSGDIYPADNTLNSDEPVTGSHDPNSKAVMPEGVGANGNIEATDSVLLYTIHFQNNGNDSAHFIIVKDTLSPYLDPLTIVPGASSHPYTFDLSENGIMTFTFNNIMLPDSTTDEPGSNGYFNYTIRQKENNPIGTVIRNTAGIYFDYNLPVITNTTVNTIADLTTAVESFEAGDKINVYPNPFSEITTFEISSARANESYVFVLTDILGKTVRSFKSSEKQFSFSKNNLRTGMYFYSISSEHGNIAKGKLIIK
jgi:hypothetical protein